MSVFDEGVTRVGELTVLERLKRENTSVHGLLAFDRSMLKSPIKIISLDSRQTTSIIDTNLSVQFAGSERFRHRNPTRTGEVFLQFDFQPNTLYPIPFKLSKACNRHSFMDIHNEASFSLNLWIFPNNMESFYSYVFIIHVVIEP